MTETVQVTNEDVKSSSNKPNSKVLKSNDNSDHGKTSEKVERPLTKVVVRHLPPTMSLESFLEQVSPLPPVDYMYFVKADSSLGLMSFSRAYLNFINVQDLIIFTEKFDNYVFIDAKGNEYPAIVEYAPFQRIPKLRSNRKKDTRAGTIENDPYYLDFVEALKAEEAQRKSASKTNKQHFFETNTSSTAPTQKVTSTPLLEYLKARRLDKIRVKEDKINEKKKRELERKKAREERGAARQGEDVHSAKTSTQERRSVRVETPAPAPTPTSASTQNQTSSAPSVDEKDAKKVFREAPVAVKRREDDRERDRGRARERRDREFVRDSQADSRPKESKRPGKSYQEERQRLNERRQAARVVGSSSRLDTDGDGDVDGDAEGPDTEVVSSKPSNPSEGETKEVVRRGDRVIRSQNSGPAKVQDTKRTFERSRRPERKPVPTNVRVVESTHREEARKKSYAQERERRNSVKKDASAQSQSTVSPTTRTHAQVDGESSSTGACDAQARTDDKKSSAGFEKEKVDSGSSASKGKDPRAERRIRNKDRPSIEIYRPGMGRFSRQRLEREKGSIVGSSTERDSASPSPSPSPSVSRAASVTAKTPSHPPAETQTQSADTQSKDLDEPAAQSADATAKSREETTQPEGVADQPKDVPAQSEAVLPPSAEAHDQYKDADKKVRDEAAQLGAAAHSGNAEKADVQSVDALPHSGETIAQSKEPTTKSEDAAAQSGDAPAQPQYGVSRPVEAREQSVAAADQLGAAAHSWDASAQSGNTAAQSEEAAVHSGDTAVQSGHVAAQSGSEAAQSGSEAAKYGDAASQSGDVASQSGDVASQSGDVASQSGDVAVQPGDASVQFGDAAVQSGDAAVQSGNAAVHSRDAASQSRDVAAQPEGAAAESVDAAAQPSSKSIDDCADTASAVR